MLKGKSAIITGSTSGIGLGIASALAAEGCDVMLNGFGDPAETERLRAELAEQHGARTAYSPADMTKPAEIRELIAETERHFGGVDMLVNNAGIQHVAPIVEFPEERWDAVIAINLSAAFHASKRALPHMIAKKWGRIVNIASAHGLVASGEKAAYVAAKHGLVGLTKVTAIETANQGVTCNAICPGWVLTPLVQQQLDHEIEDIVGQHEPARVGDPVENPPVFLAARGEQLDLVLDPAQERPVHQIGRLQIGREDQQHVERQREARAGIELQIIDLVLHRHDPAIEQIVGTEFLAAEIVDQQHAVERLDVHRRVVELGLAVVLQIDHIEGHLADGDRHRPLAGDPALVEDYHLHAEPRVQAGRVLWYRRLVQGRVEDLDDLAADFDRVGDVDDVLEHGRDAGGEGGLAVPRRSEQQHAASGVNRRQQLADVVIGYDQPLEAFVEGFAVQLFVGDALASDLRLIGGQRHRGGAHVQVLLHRFLGGGAARFAQRVAHRQAKAARHRANRLNEFLADRLVQ